MLENLYKFLNQKIAITENELMAIKEFRPFAFASIIQSFKLLGLQIIKSIAGIFILLAFDPQKSFEILTLRHGSGQATPAYSFEIHHNYHQKLRLFSFYGLSSVIAAVVIISLILSYIIPNRLPSSYAASFSKTWTTQGDFENNDITAQGATTKTNVDTAGSTGDVKLSTVGTDQTFTETFTATTNIDIANSADSASGVSGGQLQLATGTATDLSINLDPWRITTDNFDRANNTNISTSAPTSWTERRGNWDILSNKLNLNTSDAGLVNVANTSTNSTADYTVEAIVNSTTIGALEGVVGRRVNFSTTDSNGYFLHIQPGTGLDLSKRVSGVWTSIGSYATTINTATDYTIKLSMQGSTIKGFLAGIERISITDASITAAGDAGIKAENVGFQANNFTVDNLSYTGTQNALTRASNGDIYVGGNSGKFGKYTPGTDTFTDLTSKISGFWGTNNINALMYNSVDDSIFVGGSATQFAKYCITTTACGTTETSYNLTSKSWSAGGGLVNAIVFDSAGTTVYFSGGSGNIRKCDSACYNSTGASTAIQLNPPFSNSTTVFALAFDAINRILFAAGNGPILTKYCVLSASCSDSPTAGTSVNLSNKMVVSGSTPYTVSSSTYTIYSLAVASGKLYIGSGRIGEIGPTFSECSIGAGACTDSAATGVIATDLTQTKLVAAPVSWPNSSGQIIYSFNINSTNNALYLGRENGKFAKYDITLAAATDLTAKISGFWSTNQISTIVYDSTNAMIYLAGAGGNFAKFTAVGNTQNAQSIAVDTIATNIAYATLTKNDTVGTYTGTQNALARASNGDIYVGADNGKFGKYTPGTDTFTDLTSKISGFWGTNQIKALAYDTTNNVIYIGGQSAQFAKYAIAADTATNLTEKISSFWGTASGVYVNALAYDNANGAIYLGGSGSGGASRFAKCTTANSCNGAGGNATDLTAKISSFWTNAINALAFDSINGAIYLGGNSSHFAKCTTANSCDGAGGNATDLTAKISIFGWSTVFAVTYDSINAMIYIGGYLSGTGVKFAKCTTANSCNGAGGNATDLTAKISSFFDGYTVEALTYDSTNGLIYITSTGGHFAKYTPSTDTVNILTSKISGFWGTNQVYALTYDSTNGLIYLAGAGGKFAKCTATNNCDGANGNATDLSSNLLCWGTGCVNYFLSNDGANFTQINPGTKYNFTTNGTVLKWKTTLVNNGVSPTVQDITIVYNGYNATGTITNLKQDALGDAQWTTIAWTASTLSGTLVKFRTRGATNAQGAGALSTALWSPYYTTSGATITNESSVPNPLYRYVEIEMYLDSNSNGAQTPTLNDFTVNYAQNGSPDFSAITGVSQNSADGKITVNFSIRDTDSNTGTTTPGKVNLSLEYCTNAPTCSTWSAAATVAGDVGLKQVCDGTGGNGGLNCALTQYTAYSITWTPTTDYSGQYSNSYKVRIKANDAEAINNLATAESNTFEFDTKAPTLGSPAVKIDGTTNNLTLSATDDNLQNPQKQMDIAVDCASLAGNWIIYATPYDATSLIGAANPKTACVRFRDYYKNSTANTLASTSLAPTNLLIQDTTNKIIGQYQMFLSWGVVSSAAKYHIYRSTDNFASRAEVGTINSPSAPNTNYFTDTSFSTTTTAANYFGNTFSYRVTAEDANTNESPYSETKSGIPDGNTQSSEGGGTGGGGAQTGDTTPPTITSVNVKDVTATSVKITWTTNEISNSVVNYGFDLGMSNQEVVSSYLTAHEVIITGLTPNRSYLYKVSSTDASNNTKIDNNNGQGYSFTTLKQETDTVAPKIFNVDIASASTGAKISWETDENSSSYLDYGLIGKDYSKTLGKDEILKQHTINITGLNPETDYHFMLYSFDKSKNRGASQDLSFKTLSISKDESVLDELQKFLASGDKSAYDNLKKTIDEAAKNLPTPKILGDLPKIETTSTTAAIIWTTDVSSNSVVALAPTALYPASSEEPYIMTVGDFEAETTTHEVFIPNLAPSTMYHYQLRSKPVFGPEGRSRDLTFSTKSLTPEIFGEQIRKISQNQATIIWSTNIQSDSVVRYTPFRNNKPNLTETKLQGKPDLVFDHEITLLSLEYGTLYDIEIQSTDKLNNVITKKLRPFSTSIDLEAPQISQIRTESAVVPGGREQVQTIIFWKTNEAATAQIIYQEGIAEDKSKEKSTAEDTNLTQNHVIVITSFKAGQVYRFKVKSKDSFGNTSESSNFTILAPRQKESIIQVITKNFEDTFGFLKKLKF